MKDELKMMTMYVSSIREHVVKCATDVELDEACDALPRLYEEVDS